MKNHDGAFPRQRSHALQGHKIITGGNAPGTRDVRSPTLKGSHYPLPRNPRPPGRHRDLTLSGSDVFWRCVFRGRCPRLSNASPAGIQLLAWGHAMVCPCDKDFFHSLFRRGPHHYARPSGLSSPPDSSASTYGLRTAVGVIHGTLAARIADAVAAVAPSGIFA